MQAIAEAIGGENLTGTIDPNWLPQTVDAFASNTIGPCKEIMELPVHRSSVLANAMNGRLSESKSQVSFSPNADRVRNEMMKAMTAEEEKKNGKSRFEILAVIGVHAATMAKGLKKPVAR